MAVNQFLIDFELRYAWGAKRRQTQTVGSLVNTAIPMSSSERRPSADGAEF
jgi:hypothetical protein